MKRYFLFFFLTMGIFLNSEAQKKDQKTKVPKEDIKVNREYDEKGNLIRFDSLYSYSWSDDTTMLKAFSPKEFQDIFGRNFDNFPDSIFGGKSFFDDFEGMFAQPFNGKRDSILKKQFEYLNDFNFSNDSTVLKFNDSGDLFKKYGENKKDSIPSKSFHNPFGLQSKSMEEMMQMLQLQMEKMEENQRKYFNKPSK